MDLGLNSWISPRVWFSEFPNHQFKGCGVVGDRFHVVVEVLWNSCKKENVGFLKGMLSNIL